MVPGAVEVLPLNVQLMVLPPLPSAQVSVSVAPVTPKLAVATVGGVTESTADFESPPYDPVMVAETVPPTARVKAEKVALVEPASTMTVAGKVTGSLADSVTIAPPAGAAPDSVAVPMTASPPTTLPFARLIDTSAALAVTVRAGDCMLLPPIDAVIAAVPADTAVMVKVALDDPAGTVSVAGTVATAALLLASATLAPEDGAAALSVTVPWPLAPAVTLAALNVTDDSAEVGEVGDVLEPPH